MLWVAAVNIVMTACLFEIALRIQQVLGPLVNLDLSLADRTISLSDELNHLPADQATMYDRNGIRRMAEPNAAQCAPKLLFMGDSFMRGYWLTDTIPVHVKEFFSRSLGRDVCVFNAGVSSYSPSIFVPQAKKLIPLLRPDFVIIDIDETDLYDDYYRYRELVTRDASGSIVAVRRTPLAMQVAEALVASTDKIFYVHRLLSKLYFRKIEYPRMVEQYRRRFPSDVFFISKLSADEARKSAEIAYFKATLEDLTQTVLSLTGSPDRLIYIRHPHLEHLRRNGIVFNDVISATVREVASRHHVKYYDAAQDMKMDEPEKYYRPNNMHFNAVGMRIYGIAVARYLAATLPN